jgi:hypothetical protein
MRFMQILNVLTVLTASLFMGQAVAAEGALKSGLQPGEKITHIFEPLNVTGEHAGEPYCLICENGLSPVAMIFAREVSEPLLNLLSRLDAATAHHRQEQMGSFVVFLSDEAGLKEKLQRTAKERGLKQIVLAIDAPAGPDGFAVAKDADVTVVLYNEHLVMANHAFRKGELTGAASEKILADLPKILAAK